MTITSAAFFDVIERDPGMSQFANASRSVPLPVDSSLASSASGADTVDISGEARQKLMNQPGDGAVTAPSETAQKEVAQAWSNEEANMWFVYLLSNHADLFSDEEMKDYTQRLASAGNTIRTAQLFSKEEVFAIGEKRVAKQRAAVEEYIANNTTSFSGVTERGTAFTLSRDIAEDHLSIGGFTMTFTRKDGSTEIFSLENGAGFRELEDGTIVQFTSQKQVTLGGRELSALIGTEGQDILVADDGAHHLDLVSGKGGNDIIIALGRQNKMTIDGGDGDDFIFISGNTENTKIYTLDQKLIINGGKGNDTITYKSQSFGGQISGGDGDDIIKVESLIGRGSTILGEGGNDSITVGASSGNTVVMGTIDGGDGDDTLFIQGKDISVEAAHIKGGDGDDSILLLADNEVSIDGSSIEGGRGNDSILISGDKITASRSHVDGGGGSNSVSLKANQLIAKYMHVQGGGENSRILLDAKLIRLMDSQLNGGGSVSITGEDISLTRTDVQAGGDGFVTIWGDRVNIFGGHFGSNTSVKAKKATVFYADIFGKTLHKGSVSSEKRQDVTVMSDNKDS